MRNSRINGVEFVARLRAGQRDFTGMSLLGPIDTSLGDLGDLGDLILDQVKVIGDCFLGDVKANSVSLERSRGIGRFGFHRPAVGAFLCAHMHQGWFSVISGNVVGLDFSHAQFRAGFLIKNTPLDALILDYCRSPYTPFDETIAKSLQMNNARLGRREPMTLGEFSGKSAEAA